MIHSMAEPMHTSRNSKGATRPWISSGKSSVQVAVGSVIMQLSPLVSM